MFTSVRSRVVLMLSLVAVATLLLPFVAAASPYDPPYGTSLTNPSADSLGYPDELELPLPTDTSPPYNYSWWRLNWGNSLNPQFSFVHPDPMTPGGVSGFLYSIDRSPDTTLSLSTPEQYYHSRRADGTNFDLGIVNMLDVYYFDAPPGGWMYTEPGLRLPYEGHWYLHLKWYDSVGTEYPTHHVPINIDVTAPLPASKVTARPSISYTGATSGVWFPTRRVHLTWEVKAYDALSGAASYQVMVDGVDRSPSVTPAGSIYNSLTIEDLPGGKHTIDLYMVDRALNKSAKTTTTYYSDPDTPTVSVTFPTEGGKAPKVTTFKVNAFDEAGLQYVHYYVDGSYIGAGAGTDYSLTKDMSGFSNGTRTLKVVVKDMYGRIVETTRKFVLDRTPPVVSSVSDYPDPFYPILQDGYKDTMTVTYNLSEAASIHLYIYDVDGAIIRDLTASGVAGTNRLVWDGYSKDGEVYPDVFRYRIQATDSAGNVVKTGLYTTTIRDYEIIRIADNAVKVVPR